MLLTSSACFLGSITTVGLKNNDVVSDKKQCKNSINENEIITKKIDAKLIGADKGIITIKYTTPSECKITSCSWSFLATGNFNFNGGKFIYDGVEYTITEIGWGVFSIRAGFDCHFINCNLTIPSTIKKIDNEAFFSSSYHCSSTNNKEIISINFEEGVEYIGESAFKQCFCEKSKIVLPNSVQYIGERAFAYTNSTKELDLTALDHVINIEANPFDEFGFLHGCSTRIIRFKDEIIKDKYSNSQYWSSAAKYFGLDEDVYDEISSKYIGANEKSTFTFIGSSYKQAKITGVSSKFVATGNFNFNGGKFEYDGNEYVISEITHDAFHPSSTGWYFKECKLTIPSTIKKMVIVLFMETHVIHSFQVKKSLDLILKKELRILGKKHLKNATI